MTKQESPVYLHTLPMMTRFKHQGKCYRTIAPLKTIYVNSCHKPMKRDVMDLKSFKLVRLPYFTQVTIVSEKIEKCEN